MATTEQKIKENLQLLGRKSAIIFSAKVDDVNKQESTITIVDNYSIEYPDVRLKASIKDTDSVLLFPKKNSNVLVAQIGTSENDLLVIAYDEVEEIQATIENISFVANKDEIQLNGDNFGGVVKAPELKAQVDKNSQILQAILNAFQIPIPEPGNGAPSEFQKALKLATTGKQVADLSNIENEKVKHG